MVLIIMNYPPPPNCWNLHRMTMQQLILMQGILHTMHAHIQSELEYIPVPAISLAFICYDNLSERIGL